MANITKHGFVSAKADDPDTSLVNATRWNAEHVYNGGAAWQFLRRDTGATDGAAWEDPSTVYDARKNGVVAATGTNQTANLLAACAAASVSDTYKTVLLPPGIIDIVGLDLTSYHVHLRGHTNGHTVLRLFSDTDHMIKIAPSIVTNHWGFSDIRLSGLVGGVPSTTYDGIHIEPTGAGGVNFVDFSRVYTGSFRYGLGLQGAVSLCTFNNCTFGSNNQRGLALLTELDTYHRITGCWFDENLVYGLYCNNRRNVIVGNTFLDNTSVHLRLDGGASRNTIMGNNFSAGSIYGTSAVFSCAGDSNEFSWNTIADKHSSNDIVFNSGGDNNLVIGRFLNTILFSDSGSGNIIHVINDAGQYLAPTGTAAAPAYAIRGDADNGMYWSAVNSLGLSTAGLARVVIGATGNVVMQGTGAAFIPHKMTEAQRDALTPVDGMIIYNTTTGKINARESGAWVAFT